MLETKTKKIPCSDLINSYYEGDIVKFRKLIAENENINCVNEYNKSLISVIVKDPFNWNNNKEFFDELISAGVSLAPIGWEAGLLSLATEHSDTYYAKKLLENNVNVNSVGVYYRTSDYAPNITIDLPYGPPIFDALSLASIEYLNLYLDNNADVEVLDYFGRSAIHFIINHEHGAYEDKELLKEMFIALLDKGADVEYGNCDGSNVLNLIIFNKHNFLLNILFEKRNDLNINRKDGDGNTPLLNSLIYKNNDAAKFLINQGANLDLYDTSGDNALIKCIINDDMDLFNLLLDNNASLTTTSNFSKGGNIMHFVTSNDNSEINDYEKFYEIILKKHPELMLMKNNLGKTPIDILKSNKNYKERMEIFNKFNAKSIKNNKLNDKTSSEKNNGR